MKLASLIGVLTMEMVQITQYDWRKVSNQLKDELWGIIDISFRHLYTFFRHLYFFMIETIYFQSMDAI